jgi:hypothetical protein
MATSRAEFGANECDCRVKLTGGTNTAFCPLHGSSAPADLPPMPAAVLLGELIDDTSSDLADGDNPGYFRYAFDAETGTLTVTYEPAALDDIDGDGEGDDEFGPQHAATSYRFQLVEQVTR